MKINPQLMAWSSPPGVSLKQGETIKKGEVLDSFGEALNKALHKVNDLQQNSADTTNRFAAGQIEDIHQVMIASEKSSVALQLTIQIRNKILDAYQEIMRMQV